jgi:hypothetical protein
VAKDYRPENAPDEARTRNRGRRTEDKAPREGKTDVKALGWYADEPDVAAVEARRVRGPRYGCDLAPTKDALPTSKRFEIFPDGE